jgi:hypothetical protein
MMDYTELSASELDIYARIDVEILTDYCRFFASALSQIPGVVVSSYPIIDDLSLSLLDNEELISAHLPSCFRVIGLMLMDIPIRRRLIRKGKLKFKTN